MVKPQYLIIIIEFVCGQAPTDNIVQCSYIRTREWMSSIYFADSFFIIIKFSYSLLASDAINESWSSVSQNNTEDIKTKKLFSVCETSSLNPNFWLSLWQQQQKITYLNGTSCISKNLLLNIHQYEQNGIRCL